ncbi:MAG: glucose-1-phosphate thymidylyltransferase [Flavobacteriales bacterium]|nr:glucose-1-phosphate thymidylyltransferase [Flavobacteriales bacterium]
MNYILCDPQRIELYYPFTLTRPLGEMRIFGGTLKEHWEKYLGCEVSYLTRKYLRGLYPLKIEKENILLDPLDIIQILYLDKDLKKQYNKVLFEYDDNTSIDSIQSKIHSMNISSFPENRKKGLSLFIDYNINNSIASFFKSNIDCSKSPFLNDDDGPIVIEKDVTIMEGAIIKGPVYICKGTTIKMGAQIYGPTVIGPYCKIGGEVSNSTFLGFSNKAHHGFIGHSIVWEWCNIGAGTSNSNLKNDYSNVKIWDYETHRFIDSQQQFLGLFMGDHSKCAINTSFNTGTTVGVNCNIFGSGFPRNYIPSFSWGGPQGIKNYEFEKAIEVAEKVMFRRSMKLSSKYLQILREIYNLTSEFK